MEDLFWSNVTIQCTVFIFGKEKHSRLLTFLFMKEQKKMVHRMQRNVLTIITSPKLFTRNEKRKRQDRILTSKKQENTHKTKQSLDVIDSANVLLLHSLVQNHFHYWYVSGLV